MIFSTQMTSISSIDVHLWPKVEFCNEIFYNRNILIKFFLGIYFLIQDNFHSNLNKRKFIPWESFCFPWMFWKLILQKRAWVNKTARMSVSWWWQMQTTHKIYTDKVSCRQLIVKKLVTRLLKLNQRFSCR